MSDFLLGNDLIALAAVRAGAHAAYSYPGTPASEILPAFRRFAPDRFAQWSVNEKVALELSAAEAISGKRVLCAMKQVGLNAAADPLFSIAYTGIEGALVIVSADDPGPHSSQTEQDSRMYALSARIPVFDPANPRDAYESTMRAFELSGREKIPVLLRPVMRVCHSRQDFEIPPPAALPPADPFRRDPQRWAATPKFRSILHGRLLERLASVARASWNPDGFAPKNDLAVIASGYPWAILRDVLAEYPLPVDLVKVDMPYPLSREFVERHLSAYRRILVAEETFPVVEMQFRERGKVSGKEDGAIPNRGELTFDILSGRLHDFVGRPAPKRAPRADLPDAPPPAKPRLCAGCGHRPVFFAMRKAAPEGIFPGDIGCYTLGVNLGAVDSCICMGASIPFAEGLKRANPERPVIATIGDSTFFHTGIPGLLNARLSGAPVTVCILDNGTTAMTGFQPVPHEAGAGITIADAVRGTGVDFVREADPYDVKGAAAILAEAVAHAEGNGRPSVVIFRRGCVARERPAPRTGPVGVTDACRNCRICYDRFECPALSEDPVTKRAVVDRRLCIDCGVCIDVCPFDALVAGEAAS